MGINLYLMGEDCFDWENDTDIPHVQHMIAGSIAGIFEHVAMLPFDIIKTHIQTSNKSNFSYKEAARTIYRQGGFREFYRGGMVISYGVAPAHAIYFSVF